MLPGASPDRPARVLRPPRRQERRRHPALRPGSALRTGGDLSHDPGAVLFQAFRWRAHRLAHAREEPAALARHRRADLEVHRRMEGRGAAASSARCNARAGVAGTSGHARAGYSADATIPTAAIPTAAIPTAASAITAVATQPMIIH